MTLNGQPHSLDSPITITELLASLQLSGKPVVIEINQEAIIPRLFPVTFIQPNDQVEIVTLAAGG
jgi:sulfur carrier protein